MIGKFIMEIQTKIIFKAITNKGIEFTKRYPEVKDGDFFINTLDISLFELLEQLKEKSFLKLAITELLAKNDRVITEFRNKELFGRRN